MSVCCDCCVLSRRGRCDGPMPHSEKSYECCVSEYDREDSIKRRPWPTRICCKMEKKMIQSIFHTQFFTRFMSQGVKIILFTEQ